MGRPAPFSTFRANSREAGEENERFWLAEPLCKTSLKELHQQQIKKKKKKKMAWTGLDRSYVCFLLSGISKLQYIMNRVCNFCVNVR